MLGTTQVVNEWIRLAVPGEQSWWDKLEPFSYSYLGNLAQRRAEAGPRSHSAWGLKGKNPHRSLAMVQTGEKRREMGEGAAREGPTPGDTCTPRPGHLESANSLGQWGKVAAGGRSPFHGWTEKSRIKHGFYSLQWGAIE